MRTSELLLLCAKVSFGIHETEEEAARQYDRALIIEKGRSAKTNFPVSEYDVEITEYNEMLQERYATQDCPWSGLLVFHPPH